MTDTTTTPAPMSKADRIARGLIGAGALLHTIGGKMLQGSNDQLRDELAAAAARVDELADHVHVAYHLGRAHQAAAAPWSTDVLADVAEHQVHDVTGGQNPPLERTPDQRVDVAHDSADRVAEWAGAAPSSPTSTTAAAGQ